MRYGTCECTAVRWCGVVFGADITFWRIYLCVHFNVGQLAWGNCYTGLETLINGKMVRPSDWLNCLSISICFVCWIVNIGEHNQSLDRDALNLTEYYMIRFKAPRSKLNQFRVRSSEVTSPQITLFLSKTTYIFITYQTLVHNSNSQLDYIYLLAPLN